MTQNGLPIARPTPNTSQPSCESSCRWTVSDTVLGWGSRPLVFFARYLAGRLERPAVLPCVAQTGVVSPVGGDQAPGITRGVSFRVRGQSSPHRATQRLSAGRARDHPVMEIVPNKALSLSLSLSLSLRLPARRPQHRGHRLCAKMNLGTPFGVFPTASETGSRSALVRDIRN